LINRKGEREARLEEIKESRGDSQVDEKKDETYTRRSSTRKKESLRTSVPT
jgi:hypothetical protein